MEYGHWSHDPINNATRLDAFYIHAFIGVDWETGEIVDLDRFDAAARDDLAYGRDWTIVSSEEYR